MSGTAVLIWWLHFLHNAASTTHFAVHIYGQEVEARAVARDHGFTFVAKVVLISLQIPRYRDNRRHLPVSGNMVVDCCRLISTHYQFNDPFYPQQWYLHSTDSRMYNLNVLPVWAKGWTGQGITLSVLDDGLQHSNGDITSNYEPSVSYDVSNMMYQDTDPSPEPNSTDNSHGTYCAAIMAATANNSYCGVGVAYGAKVGGVRLLEGPVTDLQESLALTYGLDKVDIYSASWGPKDDGKQVDGPSHLGKAGLKKGVSKGRQGKGVIYVWAVGNGGLNGDNCNLDGYASSMYTLSVNALTETGLSCYYDEPCSSTLASIYVGGHHDHSVRHSEMNGMNVVVPELNGECRDTFQGTSAAAPMAAGIIALVLQANSDLTWRDVQHLVVETAVKTNNDSNWRTNAAGYHYHLIYGFGALDALGMVQRALTWHNVPPRVNVRAGVTNLPRRVPPGATTTMVVNVSKTSINYLEHVVVNITLRHRHRGLLQMTLVSPSETRSEILTRRKNDLRTWGFKNWDFVSVNFWGEDAEGTWTLIIGNGSNKTGALLLADLTFYGSHLVL